MGWVWRLYDVENRALPALKTEKLFLNLLATNHMTTKEKHLLGWFRTVTTMAKIWDLRTTWFQKLGQKNSKFHLILEFGNTENTSGEENNMMIKFQ